MGWLIALALAVVVLGVLLERRRRGSGAQGRYDGQAPTEQYSAAMLARRQIDRGSDGGGGY